MTRRSSPPGTFKFRRSHYYLSREDDYGTWRAEVLINGDVAGSIEFQVKRPDQFRVGSASVRAEFRTPRGSDYQTGSAFVFTDDLVDITYQVGGIAPADTERSDTEMRWTFPDGHVQVTTPARVAGGPGVYYAKDSLGRALGGPPSNWPSGTYSVSFLCHGVGVDSQTFDYQGGGGNKSVVANSGLRNTRVGETGCDWADLPGSQTVFDDSDPVVIYYVRWQNANAGDMRQFVWYRPDGTSERGDLAPIPCSNGCSWSTADIGGGSRINQPGTYRVAVEVNGVEVDSRTFEYQGTGVGSGTLNDVVLVGSDGTFGNTTGNLTINVSVQDKNGDLISSGLSTSNFAFRNVTLTRQPYGTPINPSAQVTGIEVVLPSSAGALTAVLNFDSSGSMGPGKWGPNDAWVPGNDPGAVGRRAAGEAFIAILGPEDQVAMTHFYYGYTSLLQDFTNNKSLLRAALDDLGEYGETPLWDSALDALGRLADRIGTGGVVVLLTDGLDKTSYNTADSVISTARSQDAVIYTVGLGTEPDFGELRRVADRTGGAFREASAAAALAEAFRGIGEGATTGFIRVQGTVTYPSQAPGRYTIRGELVTTVGSNARVTSFDPTIDIN